MPGNANANSARGLRGKQPVTYKPHSSRLCIQPMTRSSSARRRGHLGLRLPPVKAAEPPSEGVLYEITTTVNLKGKSGPARLGYRCPQPGFLPAHPRPFRTGNPANAGIAPPAGRRSEVFHCEWPDAGDASCNWTSTTADRHFDVTKRTVAPNG